jgi:acylphosphatase
MEEARARVVISGRVQGVSFRYYTVQEAQRRQVKGWVRNRPDGKVEAVFEGPKNQVSAMVDWCHRGSPAATVDDVEVHWETAEDTFTGFHVRF